MSSLLVAFAWLAAHWSELVFWAGLIATALANAGRAVPADRWAAIERRWPKVGQAFRFCRAAGFDVVKAGRAAWAILGPFVQPIIMPLLQRLKVKR